MTSRNRQPRIKALFTGALLVGLAIFTFGCQSRTPHSPAIATDCKRIASYSPSVTETLYALGMGDQVAGVTRYCRYPVSAQKKPKLGGGYVDPDTEGLLRLKADLVIIREEQTELIQRVQRMGLPVLTVNHRNANGILKSITDIGTVCHQETRAQKLRSQLESHIGAIRQRVDNAKTKPTVLVALDRDFNGKGIHWVFIAGKDGFYDWLIRNAGGKTALSRQGFVQISTEGVLRINPDIIIEHLPSSTQAQRFAPEVRKQWASLSTVNAIRHNRLYLFYDDYMVIPGPRFTLALERFARAIHPELDWPKAPLIKPISSYDPAPPAQHP